MKPHTNTFFRRISPGQKINELNFGQAIWQDTWDGCNAGSKEVDLWLSLTPNPRHRENMRKQKKRDTENVSLSEQGVWALRDS